MEQELRLLIGKYGFRAVNIALKKEMQQEYNYLRSLYETKVETEQHPLNSDNTLNLIKQKSYSKVDTADTISSISSSEAFAPPPSPVVIAVKEEAVQDPTIHTIQINYKGSDENNDITKKKIKKVTKIHKTDEAHDDNQIAEVQNELSVSPVVDIVVNKSSETSLETTTPKASRGRFSKEEHREAVNKRRIELENKGINPMNLLTKDNLTNWLNQGYSYQKISRETGVHEGQISALATTHGLRSNISKMVYFKKNTSKK